MSRMTVLKLALAAAIACPICAGTPAAAADGEQTRYATVTIRGRLVEPGTEAPMVGAVIQFQPVAEGVPSPEPATTDERGEFVVEGLRFGNYATVIETAEGERIYGVNELPVEGTGVAVVMKISNRIRSTTMVESQFTRFAVVVTPQKPDWKRFWIEFGVFWGVVATGGAAAL